MNTRSSSASSVATKKQYTPDEIEILMHKTNEKERQLKEQAEALQNKEEYLARLQEEADSRTPTQAAMEQIFSSMNTVVSQLEKINARITNLETMQEKEDKIPPLPQERIPTPQPFRHYETIEPTSPIRLKDAIDTIPKFDGHKMSVFHFSKICERALELIPQYHEYHLVQLIINKLQGHAYAAIEGVECNTIIELTKRLKLIFGTNKSVDQYRGELANIYMKPNEDIFDYIGRVQELRTTILDGETDLSGYIDERTKDSIETTTLNSFINGLPPDLLVRVKLERPYNFNDCMSTAIQLSKTIEAENARKRTVNKPMFQPRADTLLNQINSQRYKNNNTNNNNDNSTRNQNFQPNGLRPSSAPFPSTTNRTQSASQPSRYYQTKICRYCKTPGHLIDECRKLAYRRASENLRPNGSENPQGVPPRDDARRNETPLRRTYPLPNPANMAIPQSSAPLDTTSAQ